MASPIVSRSSAFQESRPNNLQVISDFSPQPSSDASAKLIISIFRIFLESKSFSQPLLTLIPRLVHGQLSHLNDCHSTPTILCPVLLSQFYLLVPSFQLSLAFVVLDFHSHQDESSYLFHLPWYCLEWGLACKSHSLHPPCPFSLPLATYFNKALHDFLTSGL